MFDEQNDPYPLPYGRIAYKNDQQICNEINNLIDSELVTTVILGLPTLLDGTETNMTRTIRYFGSILEKSLKDDIYFEFHDETLSTYEAEQRMKASPRYNFNRFIDWSYFFIFWNWWRCNPSASTFTAFSSISGPHSSLYIIMCHKFKYTGQYLFLQKKGLFQLKSISLSILFGCWSGCPHWCANRLKY